jgi:probable rRNA maturation factor
MPPPRLNLTVQYACDTGRLPGRSEIRAWSRATLNADEPRGAEITIRFTGLDEARVLNRDYRHKDYATNILSFVYDASPFLRGDIVICVPVVEREAREQNKSITAHAAHLIVHGLLHLQGYDHETGENEARFMEKKEREILASLGFPDPYAPSGAPLE